MKETKKLKGFSHYILTRFNNGIYDREDSAQWMRDRMKLFADTKKSILSQKGDFKWVISFDEKTPEAVIEEVCTDDRMISTTKDIRNCFEDIKVNTEFVITSRMDNDDQYLKGAILAIQKEFQPQVYVIDIDYYQYDTVNGQKYTSGNKLKKEKLRELPNSPFLSLVEPSDEIHTCYCRPHNKLIDGYPNNKAIRTIPAKKIRKPFALMVIHDENMMNKITGYKI